MATKSDFTLEEWRTLLSVPVAAGMLVVIADLHVGGTVRELHAMEAAEADPTSAGAARPLVEALIADMKPYEGDQDTTTGGDDAKAEYLALVQAGAQIVDGRCGAEEAAGYKQWVMATARATAEAAREGGFPRALAPTVSDKERAAIREVESALRL